MKKAKVALVLLLAVMLVAGIACTSLSLNNVSVDWDYEGIKYYLSNITFELKNAGSSRARYDSVEIYANDELVGSKDKVLFGAFDPGATHAFEFTRCMTGLECLHEYSAYGQELIELKIIIRDGSDIITTYSDTITPTQ
jgi:hypothetical protein